MEIEELHKLISQHGKAIYSFCRKLAGNKADTDDLYQETFLKALEVRDRLDLQQNPKSFLLSIAIRLRNNSRRKFAWRQRIAPTAELTATVDMATRHDVAATPEDAVLSLELRGAIQAAADQLNDKLKIPLYMYYTAEMSIDEIAAALSIPAGTVKSRLHQARKAMREKLEVEAP